VLAVLLFLRKPNDRMALSTSFILLLTAPPSGISLDYFLTAYFGTPSVLLLAQNLQTPLWVLIFCIFPDGRFVPGWTRWLFLLSIFGSASVFVDPAWYTFFNTFTIPLFILITYAQVYRYRRVSNIMERKQTKWVVLSFIVSIVLSVIASLIYKKPSPPLLNVTPIALTIAILRSHLWDIDIIIRRTLKYTLLTGLLAIIYFGSVVALQSLTTAVGGQQTGVVTVISTIGIAALFNPLRRRVQDFIDRRFFRKKYNAEQTLANFAIIARDKVEIDKLSAALLGVIEETMQPDKVSLWLKDSHRMNLHE